MIYKALIAGDATRAEREGVTSAKVDLADGFVHFSTRAQLAETLRLHFGGQAAVVLYEFEVANLLGELRWEASRGGDLFPHLYGPLDVRTAARRWTLSLGPDDAPELPNDL
ncbi:MAG: DUF952 domain-containing protein [Pseudomonadota bacterium]